MKKRHPVIFIAFEDFDNLGVRYIASVIKIAGYVPTILNLRTDFQDLLKTIKRLKPLLVGFSVVYQYNIDRFVQLVRFLRKEGINCHFTAGGHYASLRYEELFRLIPGLDSIVRFEGENTLLELVKALSDGTGWSETAGIAYKRNRKIFINSIRPFEKDLDKFPYPLRSDPGTYALDQKFSTIIAGRGCANDCAFCNLKEFYIQSSGPRKRLRNPEKVVREMEYLYKEKGCTVFLFEDDDFPAKYMKEKDWIVKFCQELKNKDLAKKIFWKINCRPDEIEEKTFSIMKRMGLYMVFLGIDDGTDEGLKWINKHMSLGKSMDGINILKKLGIYFDYGFMLFHPLTTFNTLYLNLDFLRHLCADGHTSVSFLKMMPYYETRIEKELIAEGRIKGKPGYRNYDFIEVSMNHYHEFISELFEDWLLSSDGLLNMSKWAKIYFAIYQHLYLTNSSDHQLFKKLNMIISESNLFMLDKMEELAISFQNDNYGASKKKIATAIRHDIILKHDYFREQINNIMQKLLRLVYERQPFMMPDLT